MADKIDPPAKAVEPPAGSDPDAGTATLSQCAQVLAQLLAHFKQRGDLAL